MLFALPTVYWIVRIGSIAYFTSKREYQHQFLKELEGEKSR